MLFYMILFNYLENQIIKIQEKKKKNNQDLFLIIFFC
jgi:hypothetical protein